MKNLVKPLQCDFNPKLAGAILLRRATVWHDRVEVQSGQDRHVGLAGRPQVVDQRLRQLKLLDGQTFSSFRGLKQKLIICFKCCYIKDGNRDRKSSNLF
jgi:hypothetical protein